MTRPLTLNQYLGFLVVLLAILFGVSLAKAAPCYPSQEAAREVVGHRLHLSYADVRKHEQLWFLDRDRRECRAMAKRMAHGAPLPKANPTREASRPSAPVPAPHVSADTLRASDRAINVTPASAAAVPLPSAEALKFVVGWLAAEATPVPLTTGTAAKLTAKPKEKPSDWGLYIMAAIIGLALLLGFLLAKKLKPRETKRVPELSWQKQVQLAYAAEGVEKPWHRPLKQAA